MQKARASHLQERLTKRSNSKKIMEEPTDHETEPGPAVEGEAVAAESEVQEEQDGGPAVMAAEDETPQQQTEETEKPSPETLKTPPEPLQQDGVLQEVAGCVTLVPTPPYAHNYILRVRVKITDRINGEGLGSGLGHVYMYTRARG